MKKILLSFVLLLGGVLFANAQTLWESKSSDGTLATWSTATAECNGIIVAAGDIIKVTVKSVNTSIDKYPQAFLMTAVGENLDWTELSNVGMPSAGIYAYEITAEMADKISEHQRIFLKGTAAYILKVELVPNDTKSLLWESGSEEGVLVKWEAPTAQCDGVVLAAGDLIRVTVKSVDKKIDNYPQANLVAAVGKNWDWVAISNTSMPSAGSYFYGITAEMIENINSHQRIFLQGTAAYISKVELIKNVTTIPVEISEYEWATFVSDKALVFANTGIKAYAVTGHSGTAITKSDALTKVPANTPLLLNAAKGSYNIPVISTASAIGTNLLKAGTGAAISKESGKTKYVLGVTGGKAEFQKINTTAATVPTGKAYLEFSEVIEARSLDFDDEGTTAIKNMKVGENDNIYYDLQGRRVLYPKNGLYIVNGKKVILK